MATLNATLSLTSKDTTIKNKVALVFSKQISTTNPVIHSGTSVSATVYVYVKNLDSSNYVALDTGAGAGFGILYPGDFAYYAVQTTKGLKLQANTATCLVEYGIFTKA